MQFNILQLLTESDAAVIASNRGLLALDTAVGFLPSHAAVLKASNIHVLAPGIVPQDFPNSDIKSAAKQKLGLEGKTVLLTAGVMNPDKVIRCYLLVFVKCLLFYLKLTAEIYVVMYRAPTLY